MPELPEVETVRRGLARLVVGQRIDSVTVFRDRTIRRQTLGADYFVASLAGNTITAVERRGKYLWLTLQGTQTALVAHLGMSGQFRHRGACELSLTADYAGQERVRLHLSDGQALSFVDQRTFGWLVVDDLGDRVPRSVAHIAADPFDPDYSLARTSTALRHRRTGLKRALLDQTTVSGIGNIYADEALWRARLHPDRATATLSAAAASSVLLAAAEVMAEALAAGGTSFDPLYVNVNGESGWFARELSVYGRSDQACYRCGSLIVREAFMNRSSYRCPRCQRTPPMAHRHR